jgi:hypothetical protein
MIDDCGVPQLCRDFCCLREEVTAGKISATRSHELSGCEFNFRKQSILSATGFVDFQCHTSALEHVYWRWSVRNERKQERNGQFDLLKKIR